MDREKVIQQIVAAMVALLGNTCIVMYQNTISQRHIVPHLLYMLLVDSFVIPLNASQEGLQSLVSEATIFSICYTAYGSVTQSSERNS